MIRIDVRQLIMDEVVRIGKTRPIDSIQVSEICERCGISRTTFYSYFHDKYDIISQIYRKTITDVMEKSDETVPWEKVIGKMLENVKKDEEFYMNAVRYTGQNSLTEMMLFHIYTSYVKELTRRIGEKPGNDLLFQVRYNAHGGTGIMLDWISTGMVEDPYAVAERIFTCMPSEMKSYFS